MKNKLFYILFIALLSSIGLSAKADVLVNTSACQVVHIANMSGGGYMKGLECPAETDYWLVYFVRWSYGYPCAPYATTPYYRVEGTCDNFVVYRVE